MSSEGKGSVVDKDDKYSKPLKSAPPPGEAVIFMIILTLISTYYLPYLIEHISSYEATKEVFLKRLHPEHISVEVLINTRLAFGLFCFCVTLYQVFLRKPTIMVPYLLPQSKLVKCKVTLKGRLSTYMFTSWSWMLLGLHFLLSSYVTRCIYYNSDDTKSQLPIPTWIIVLALVTWKISAPMTMLVGSVVKYALWPAAYKQNGPDHTMKYPLSLIQHNLNIIMALSELLLLGGLPVGMKHFLLPLIFGVLYVYFSWATMMHWNPNTGPFAVYFFMDTTLGRTHTISLLLLLITLVTFYALFCGIEYLMGRVSDGTQGMGQNIVIMLVLCLLTCRFRD